jgi:hypothetical protein
VSELRSSKNALLLAAALCLVLLGSCDKSGVSEARVESAIAPTFANLIETQESMLGLPPLDVTLLHASASCHRLGPGSDPQGAGKWLCTLEWSPPNHRTPWRDAYELEVTPDGCYTATADSEDNHLGGPKLTLRDGTVVTNLLYVFDGCFDAT